MAAPSTCSKLSFFPKSVRSDTTSNAGCCYTMQSASDLTYTWFNISAVDVSASISTNLSVIFTGSLARNDSLVAISLSGQQAQCVLASSLPVKYVCADRSVNFRVPTSSIQISTVSVQNICVLNTTCTLTSTAPPSEVGNDKSNIDLGPLGKQPLWLIIVCIVLFILIILSFVYVIYRRNRGSGDSAALFRPNTKNINPDEEYAVVSRDDPGDIPNNNKTLVDLSETSVERTISKKKSVSAKPNQTLIEKLDKSAELASSDLKSRPSNSKSNTHIRSTPKSLGSGLSSPADIPSGSLISAAEDDSPNTNQSPLPLLGTEFSIEKPRKVNQTALASVSYTSGQKPLVDLSSGQAISQFSPNGFGRKHSKSRLVNENRVSLERSRSGRTENSLARQRSGLVKASEIDTPSRDSSSKRRERFTFEDESPTSSMERRRKDKDRSTPTLERSKDSHDDNSFLSLERRRRDKDRSTPKDNYDESTLLSMERRRKEKERSTLDLDSFDEYTPSMERRRRERSTFERVRDDDDYPSSSSSIEKKKNSERDSTLERRSRKKDHDSIERQRHADSREETRSRTKKSQHRESLEIRNEKPDSSLLNDDEAPLGTLKRNPKKGMVESERYTSNDDDDEAPLARVRTAVKHGH
ncbi:hypothetical protein HK096_002220 [Nowakowskiella sp. JEL0078]|nr:hypothetical protein HK096_002220 [Nowakowskiella sp. JEL0078]